MQWAISAKDAMPANELMAINLSLFLNTYKTVSNYLSSDSFIFLL